MGDFRQSDAIKTRLLAGGLSTPAAEAKADLFVLCAGALSRAGAADKAGAIGFYVPGRIEVLGKHTDYAGGRSVLAATEKGFCVVACPREDTTVRMHAAGSGQTAEFAVKPDLAPVAGGWSNYPMTVARRLARNFGLRHGEAQGGLRGADIAFASDLPPASGMSSSSALLVASYLVLAEINDLKETAEYRRNIPDAEALAGYLGCVENGQSFGELAGDKGVGTFGGSEDHTAILCCRAGKLSRYSYCPVRFERTIELPEGCVFAVGCSGVVAEKTGAAREKYNRASHLARAVADAWNLATGRNDPHVAAAIRGAPDAVSRMQAVLRGARGGPFTAAELLGRFQQFHGENEEVIPNACDALARGDPRSFGEWVDRSQRLAEDLLGNQVPQTVSLARSARELGAAAASSFGAGFGGSVWALVGTDWGERFVNDWSRRYAEAFPAESERASFFLTRPGPAAFAV
jgi:galactokinase